MRQAIEARCGIDATDIYGLSEVMGPGVAQEFVTSKDGPTIWGDHFYPEIIDPETGDVLPDGEEGELVFTSLTKQAFPLIRYRTRDLTRLLPGSETVMRRIAQITGRSDDMLIIRGVNVFPSQIEELLLQHSALSPHYQIGLSREGNMDAVRLHIEPIEGVDAATVEAQGAALVGSIKSYVGSVVPSAWPSPAVSPGQKARRSGLLITDRFWSLGCIVGRRSDRFRHRTQGFWVDCSLFRAVREDGVEP